MTWQNCRGLWERFGCYGTTAVVVIFMVQELSYAGDRANLTFGAFTFLARVSDGQSLPPYTNLFIELGVVAVIGTVVAAALLPLTKRLPEAGTEAA